MLTERQRQILDLIVSLYSKEKTPVGSKALLDEINASSATIRNDMKVLENEGFIKKEHSSSGRIPELSGYEFFVDHLLDLEQSDEHQRFQVVKAFDGEFYRLSDIFDKASKVLSNLTGLTSFVLNVPQSGQTLKSFDMLMIDAHSVLAVMMLDTGEIRSNQVILPKSMTEKDLQTFVEIVRDKMVEKKLLEIHYILRTEIPQIIQHYFKITHEVLQLFETIFDELFVEKLTSNGRQQIYDYSPENSHELYKLFSDDARMLQELRALTADDELRKVKFNASPHLQNLTVISQKFVIPYRGLGTLAVIGPIEMNYPEILAVVDLVGKVLSMKLTDFYRYLDGNHYEIT